MAARIVASCWADIVTGGVGLDPVPWLDMLSSCVSSSSSNVHKSGCTSWKENGLERFELDGVLGEREDPVGVRLRSDTVSEEARLESGACRP